VVVTRRPALSVTFTATAGADDGDSQRWTFDATVTGATASEVESYTWDFGDDSGEVETSGDITSHVYEEDGPHTVTLTIETQDGRTATAREEIIVEFE
jgi:PKD repeat protein